MIGTLALGGPLQWWPEAGAATGLTLYVNALTDGSGVSDCTAPTNTDCGLDNAIDAFNADSVDNDADAIVVGISPSPFLSEGTAIDNVTPGVTLSISGGGPSESLISQDTQVNDFTIYGGVTNVSNLTIENGEQEGGFGGGIDDESGTLTVTNDEFLSNFVYIGGYGGAIACNNGALTATNDTFANNYNHNGDGGAIAGNNCTLIADNDTFANNTSNQGEGGAVINLGGTLTLNNDTFSDNSATSGGAGGAVFNNVGSGVATISGDSFVDNTADGGGAIADYDAALSSSDNTFADDSSVGNGGGGALWDTDGAVTSTNDTFANDTATGNGGGGALQFSSGTMDATDDTFSNDSAVSGGGGLDSAASGATISDSILDDAGCDGAVTDGGYNVESDDSCGFGSSDIINSLSINLANTLAANDSSGAETFSIGPGSSAFEEVPAGDCAITTDERSLPRPGEPGSACDAGAYEYQYAPAVLQLEFQSISFLSLSSVVISAPPFALTASSTSGLPVSFASTSPSVCATNGPLVRLLATGTCSITASQAGNGQYLPADSVVQSFQVTGAPLAPPTRPLVRATSPFDGRLRIVFVTSARGATHYQYSLDDGAWRSLAGRGPFVISGLVSGVSMVRVRGLNSAGPGPSSRAARTRIRS